MKEVTVQELKSMFDNKEDFQLIDVREEHEYEMGHLNGLHIPMGSVMDQVDKVDKSKKVIVHCNSGSRSAAVINALEKQFGFTNLYNLKGGIKAYVNEIDPTVMG